MRRPHARPLSRLEADRLIGRSLAVRFGLYLMPANGGGCDILLGQRVLGTVADQSDIEEWLETHGYIEAPAVVH